MLRRSLFGTQQLYCDSFITEYNTEHVKFPLVISQICLTAVASCTPKAPSKAPNGSPEQINRGPEHSVELPKLRKQRGV